MDVDLRPLGDSPGDFLDLSGEAVDLFLEVVGPPLEGVEPGAYVRLANFVHGR
jgi:hypothetical protein